MHVKMEHVRTCFYFELCKGIDCGFKGIKKCFCPKSIIRTFEDYALMGLFLYILEFWCNLMHNYT